MKDDRLYLCGLNAGLMRKGDKETVTMALDAGLREHGATSYTATKWQIASSCYHKFRIIEARVDGVPQPIMYDSFLRIDLEWTPAARSIEADIECIEDSSFLSVLFGTVH